MAVIYRGLCSAKDGLYLLEAGDWRNNRPNNLPVSVLVLSLQGNTIQVYTHPEGHSFADICAFDGKLLARTWGTRPRSQRTSDDQSEEPQMNVFAMHDV